MSRLGEFALRYAALRDRGAPRLQAAKQAAREAAEQEKVEQGLCPGDGTKLRKIGGGTSGRTVNGVETVERVHWHYHCPTCERFYTHSRPVRGLHKSQSAS